jgi:hypothetical protein
LRWPRADRFDEMRAVDAGDRRLAGGIHVGDDDLVGLVETLRKFFEQIAQARVAVWLHHRDHLALAGLARRLQHRCDLDRVMAVIVYDRNPIRFAGFGKPPLYALESAERPPQHALINI